MMTTFPSKLYTRYFPCYNGVWIKIVILFTKHKIHSRSLASALEKTKRPNMKIAVQDIAV